MAATSRAVNELRAAVGSESANFLPLAVKLAAEASVGAASSTATVRQFGRLDVVVNNAGYGQLGGLEEVSDAEARENFDVNVFGTLHVIRHALPQLHQQRGHILNFSSIVGILGSCPGWDVYTVPPSLPLRACQRRRRPKWPRSASRSRWWRRAISAPTSSDCAL